MADLTEIEQWDEGVYQLETTDPVEGGADGIDNKPNKALANRTKWLKKQLEELGNQSVQINGDQDISDVKTFSSSPIVPTPTTNTQVANKKYVDEKLIIKIERPVKVAYNQISIDGTTLTVSGPVSGTDYYFSKTAITTVKNIDTIGGFHYSLTQTTEGATGNKTSADMTAIAGINAYSIWTNWFRPTCDPKGMVHIGGKWYDIYLLNSEHIINGTSKAGATIAAGATSYGRAIPKIPLEYGGNGSLNYGKLTWFQVCEIAKSHGKELISYAEFPTIAYGVNEAKSSSTNGYESVAGKVEHYSNLTSKFGIEQATGVQYIWGKDLMNGYGSTAFALKSETDGRGQIYSTSNSPTAVILGGLRDDGVNAGSRCSNWNNYVWNSNWNIGCRFACEYFKIIALM